MIDLYPNEEEICHILSYEMLEAMKMLHPMAQENDQFVSVSLDSEYFERIDDPERFFFTIDFFTMDGICIGSTRSVYISCFHYNAGILWIYIDETLRFINEPFHMNFIYAIPSTTEDDIESGEIPKCKSCFIYHSRELMWNNRENITYMCMPCFETEKEEEIKDFEEPTYFSKIRYEIKPSNP